MFNNFCKVSSIRKSVFQNGEQITFLFSLICSIRGTDYTVYGHDLIFSFSFIWEKFFNDLSQ